MRLQQFKVNLTQYHLFLQPPFRRPHIQWTAVLCRLSNLLNDVIWQQFQQYCYLVVKVKRDLHGNWWFVLVPTGSFYFILADDFYFGVFHLNQHIFYVILLADMIPYAAQSVVLQYNAHWVLSLILHSEADHWCLIWVICRSQSSRSIPSKRNFELLNPVKF